MTVAHSSFTTAELRAEGWTRARIAAAVYAGAIIRARRGVYVESTTPDAIVRAVRVGGRLTCLSLLALLGIFVHRNDKLHVHLRPTASRMRSPHSRRVRLEPRSVRGARLHWLPLADVISSSSTCVDIVDALAHSVLCQSPRAAIATLDSALHLGFVTVVELGDVFRLLPAKYSVLRGLLDGRAESGPESMMRLMLRGLGCDVELQVDIAGIGRVDLVVDGWLVIECDSEQFHSGWQKQEDDRRRDLLLAARGYSPLRPTAVAIMNRPEEVIAAVRGLLRARRELQLAI